MAKKYGAPYQGSKSAIAEWVVGVLPSAGCLYDLFAGGCAVTHAAILSGKWGRIHANDISDAPRLFADAVDGRYEDERRWISREDFFALKGADPYVRVCWSFGNNGRGYMYSRAIEPYKKACHYAIVFDDWGLLAELCPEVVDACKDALCGISDTKQRRLAFGPAVVRWLRVNGTAEMVADNPLYNSCHKRKDKSLERLRSLQSLERLERLQVTQLDYRKVEIEDDCVIYCDIPYNTPHGKSNRNYGVNFDYTAFFDWAASQSAPVFISEYNIDDDRFVELAGKNKVCSLSATATSVVRERIYIPRHQEAMIGEMIDKRSAVWPHGG